MVNPQAVKAEVVFGLQLVTRHRAPRLAALLGLGVAALAAASQPSPARVTRVLLLLAGTIAAVAASRLLAPGPALAAARVVVGPWWVVVCGRLLGMLCVVGPITLGVGLGLGSSSPADTAVLLATAVALVFGGCVGSSMLAVAPWWGASAAASLGFLGVWFGGVPPSTMAVMFAGWPPLQRVAIWLWNVLPLPWRAARWLESGGWGDPLLFAAWTLIGLGVAATHLAGPRRTGQAQS